MKAMEVIKVDARRNKSITLNEILSKPLNNPAWIDTTESNRIFDEIQENNRSGRDYVKKHHSSLYEPIVDYGLTNLLLDIINWFKNKFKKNK
jgi:hypothetical protein